MVRVRHVDTFFHVRNEEIEKIKREIGEDEDKLRHVENLVDQWIQCKTYLPKNYDRNMIRNFIRGSKFNMEVTKRKWEGYFLAKYAFPEFYQERNPNSKEIAQVLDAYNLVWMPKLTKNGERIFILSVSNPDPSLLDITSGLKLFWMISDLMLTCEFPVSGEIAIFDGAHATSSHFTKFLSMPFKNSLSILRSAYAARISQIHIINCPPMLDKVISSLRPLVHEKVKDKFIIHKDLNALYEYLSPDLLPADFGGTLNSLRNYMKQWKEILTENLEWLKEQENIQILGKPPKRISKFTNTIGLEGSFRQLNID